MSFIPETLPRVVIARSAKQDLEKEGETDVVVTPPKVNVLQEMRFVTTMTFRILFTEPIITFLGIFNGFAYGLMFLYLDGIIDVFVDNNGLRYATSRLFPCYLAALLMSNSLQLCRRGSDLPQFCCRCVYYVCLLCSPADVAVST